MTGLAWVLLAVAGVVALVDWVAVVQERQRLEWVCKPATLAALVGVALALDPENSTVRWWFVAALVLSLVGDVFLMLPDDRFKPGVAAFAAAHVAYVGGFVAAGLDRTWVLLGILFVLMAVAAVGRPVVAAAKAESPEDAVPVQAYLVIVSLMLVAAIGSGNPVAIAGAILFYWSDAMIAWSRFITAFPHHRIAIITTYHLGQALLVVSLLTLG